MSPQQLVDVAQELTRLHPNAELVKNAVGNLAIMVDSHYIGFIDLQTGKLELDATGGGS